MGRMVLRCEVQYAHGVSLWKNTRRDWGDFSKLIRFDVIFLMCYPVLSFVGRVRTK
jgi:hypothetical protein